MSQELVTHFESSTREFCSLAKSVPTEKLHLVPEPGEWPIAYVIHHLADSDAHFLVRFLNVLTDDNPDIVAFDEEIFPVALRYEGRSVLTSIAAIEASCSHLVDILRQVSADDWKRTGVHAKRGELTLKQILELTTNHRVGHIDQIKK